jgi:hypothetical protein
LPPVEYIVVRFIAMTVSRAAIFAFSPPAGAAAGRRCFDHLRRAPLRATLREAFFAAFFTLRFAAPFFAATLRETFFALRFIAPFFAATFLDAFFAAFFTAFFAAAAFFATFFVAVFAFFAAGFFATALFAFATTVRTVRAACLRAFAAFFTTFFAVFSTATLASDAAVPTDVTTALAASATAVPICAAPSFMFSNESPKLPWFMVFPSPVTLAWTKEISTHWDDRQRARHPALRATA